MTAWLLFIYRVPSEPARKRTFIWRKLNRMHVLYLQRTVCLLPELDKNVKELEVLVEKVEEFGGEATLLRVMPKTKEWQTEIEGRFDRLWIAKYDKIDEEITKFIDEIHLEEKRKRYTSEEVEELDEKLETLQRWFEKVRRQGGSAKLKLRTSSHLRKASEHLERFSHKVEKIEDQARLKRPKRRPR